MGAAFLTLFGFIAWGIPVGVALGLAGIVGAWLVSGSITSALNLAGLVSFQVSSTYAFMVVPMFIFMGELASYGGISGDLFEAAYKNVGRLPGGLAIATTFTAAGFAAVTGSGMSSCVAMTKIALPQMNKFKYNPTLSTGCIASASTFAMMIPPSIMLVTYAIFAEQSVGALLLAGAIPGLITAIIYSLSILLRVHFNPSLGPRGPMFSWKDRTKSIAAVFPFLLLLGGILGGILFGVWSPVEAGAAGVILVLLMGIIRGRLTWRMVFAAARGSTVASTCVFIVVIGSLIFGKFLALSGGTQLLIGLIVRWCPHPLVLFSVLVAFYIFLGCFLEGISMLALTIPVVLPVVIAIGWSPVWFGIIAVKLIEIAAITPPIGLSLYAMKGAAPDIPIGTIMRGVIPFIPCDVFVLVLLYFLPNIALWLPNMMIS